MGGSTPFASTYQRTIGKVSPTIGGSNISDPLGVFQPDPPPKTYADFTFDPNQSAQDTSDITGLANSQGAAQTALGQSQYDQAGNFITQDQASRATARDALAKALTTQSQASFQQALPQTEEDLNAQHLLNGSGLGQALGIQQGNIATNIANQIGTLGAADYGHASDQRAAALQGLFSSQDQGLSTTQGGATDALSRRLGMQDFIKQANLSKTLGQIGAPIPPSGKAAGSAGAMQGASAGSSGGWLGSLIGGGLGYAAGKQSAQR